MSDDETTKALRESFWYGSRSNLDFKYFKDLSDTEFGDFVEDLLGALSETMDDGDADGLIEVAQRWQQHAYTGHLGDPREFPHAHDHTPIASLSMPLTEAKIGLLTSSGHFIEGDDPEPFGVANMTQAEAESRIVEFLGAAPTLSEIPVDTPAGQLRVRHGGYPVNAVAKDHQVALPLGHLQGLASEGAIGEVASTAYSFVGATSQLRLQNDVAPMWAERLLDDGVDAVLLVPV